MYRVLPQGCAPMSRFEARKYREDFAGLTHHVIDTESGDAVFPEIVDDAMSPDEAQDLADAMNGLDAFYKDLEVYEGGDAK
jgi:hypothetical protein